MRLGEFVCNVVDPDRSDAKAKFLDLPIHNGHEEMDWRSHLAWIEDFVRGQPKATKKHSTEQLAESGLIGLYEKGGG